MSQAQDSKNVSTSKQPQVNGATTNKSIGLDRQIDKLEDRWNAKEDKRAAGSLAGQKARSKTEKVLTRTTSGAIYALVVLTCLFCGRFTTTLLIMCMAWLCCSEFYRISRMGGRMPNESIGLAAALLFPLTAYARGLVALVIVTFLLLFCIACWYVFTPRANIADVAVTALGPLYTSLAFSTIVLIRAYDKGIPGALLALGVMLSIWGNDACAYFVGSKIGVHKLAPRISPNKSWEGFYGGLFASVVIWVLMSVLGIVNISVPFALFSGLVVGFFGVIGDLFESRIKRGVGVKDSGNLMPGHGGLLDRSDSLLFGCMAAYFLLLVGGVLV